MSPTASLTTGSVAGGSALSGSAPPQRSSSRSITAWSRVGNRRRGRRPVDPLSLLAARSLLRSLGLRRRLLRGVGERLRTLLTGHVGLLPGDVLPGTLLRSFAKGAREDRGPPRGRIIAPLTVLIANRGVVCCGRLGGDGGALREDVLECGLEPHRKRAGQDGGLAEGRDLDARRERKPGG